MQQQTVIGIDLGGTAIKIGQFLRDGTCVNEQTVATPNPPDPKAVVSTIAQVVKELDPDSRAIALGIGTPGPADAEARTAQYAINLEGWINVPLADLLEAQLHRPTFVANDANCAGLGESWLGAGREADHLILLTLGTGVGGAIILNNELFTGPYGAAGELGLITINPQGKECNSGNHGSLEQHLCVATIQQETGKTPAELGKLAKAGDDFALSFWKQYGETLGVGLTNLIYVLTPEAIIIGGGISASAEFFLPTAWQEIEKRVVATSQARLQLFTAELGNQAGMVGAAKLAWQKMAK